ncbi:hypothetical protein GEMRC1_006265 [Eukaryota sp. GEM-RC1]
MHLESQKLFLNPLNAPKPTNSSQLPLNSMKTKVHLYVLGFHCFLVAALVLLFDSFLSSCLQDRPKHLSYALELYYLHSFSLLSSAVLFVIPRGTRSHRLFLVSLTSSLYLISYFMMTNLRTVLGDLSCSTKPNSISGHYHFYIYVLVICSLFYGPICLPTSLANQFNIRQSSSFSAFVSLPQLYFSELTSLAFILWKQVLFGILFAHFTLLLFFYCISFDISIKHLISRSKTIKRRCCFVLAASCILISILKVIFQWSLTIKLVASCMIFVSISIFCFNYVTKNLQEQYLEFQK